MLMFFFQYLAQAGVLFTIPLFLSVVLELSALETGIRIIPLSLALLVAAIAVPRLFPQASPRFVVRAGLLAMIAATIILIARISPSADAAVVAIPMLLMGFGMGALSSQLGAVTVSAAPEQDADEVGGLQNTARNLGASVGTALAGSVLISALSSGLLLGLQANPKVSAELQRAASTQLTGNVAFVSTTQLEAELAKSDLSASDQQAVLDANTTSRTDALDAALSVLALIEVIALGCSVLIQREPLSSARPSEKRAQPGGPVAS
jgi:MFS family permease